MSYSIKEIPYSVEIHIIKMFCGKMVIYGGRGALGTACVNHFKKAKWWIANVDFKHNDRADYNISPPVDASWVQQEEYVANLLDSALRGEKLKAIICTAGGWIGGNASSDLCKQADLMWRQSVWSSTIAATIASKYLCPRGMLALTGARCALESTPRMIGYGMAKAAVHHLTRSLGAKDSGLPENSLVVTVLPMTLETEKNRKWMPKADFSTWTPPTFVAELLETWIDAEAKCRPPNGSLIELQTKDNITQVIVTGPEELDKIGAGRE